MERNTVLFTVCVATVPCLPRSLISLNDRLPPPAGVSSSHAGTAPSCSSAAVRPGRRRRQETRQHTFELRTYFQELQLFN